MDEDHFWEPEEPEEEEVEDEYVEEAKPALLKFLDEHREKVFYLKQIQVLFEKPFFHWVTARALYGLEDEGLLRSEIRESPKGTRVRLVFHKSHRYRQRQADRLHGKQM
jgi:hypothetical protein